MRRALPITLSAAFASAEPPTAIEREPNVPVPAGTAAVSPSTIRILEKSIPSRSWRIWANAVAWPWPWLCVPRKAVTLPSAATRTCAAS
jgi:hypothetical protein